MHTHNLENWRHGHEFSGSHPAAEKRTRQVLALTAVMMVMEVVGGTMLGSMALLADGWHMGTHVAAFMIALFAYRYARRHANSSVLTFGAGKVSVLGGFASAVALAVVALLMCVESIQRMFEPQMIHFNEAIAVAVLGLLVNLLSAVLLSDGHDHHHHGHTDGGHDNHPHHGHAHDSHEDHEHSHDEHHHHHHHDHNLRAAYMHVLADALTSVLAIIALLAGKYFGWYWLDPVMGIVGAVIITRWSIGLLRETGPILLDTSIAPAYADAIRDAIERDGDNRVSDLHVWKVGSAHYAAIIAVVTHTPKPVEHYKSLLHEFHQLVHITIEVNGCDGGSCRPQRQPGND
ncbi:CDF family Co(II)/Ni(II) efflux transporter DmeF [Mariprofundus erugo]|uniref:CDF family Co(II)/Ni(II) efflux transporter DmeF n=1 Tax=Mariprofundus erugo TaxID=2528639 RepID=UPI0010FF30FC|nr:CDF family Co(II)/Ni(II) efflux transporter DmeF [Mariprofundus erugo]TLS77276.1 CDF family Co(II)/Ni(II) efflux transporter DmeF [Mariprofundus erugo]